MSRRVRVVVLALSLLAAGLIVAPTAADAVIGGATSGYGPWAVRMLVDGKPHCTGTAVSPTWIVSASHCFFDRPDAPVADKRIEFRVGNLDQRKGTRVHPVRGGRVESPSGADVMLIKVPRMTVPGARLSTVDAKPGQRVRDFGWGATCTGDENACQSNVLKQADLKVLSAKDKRCQGYGTTDGADFCSIRVAGVPAGGDSGGPIMTVAPRGKEVLIGVFWGSDRTNMVGAASVSHQLRWIRSVIGK